MEYDVHIYIRIYNYVYIYIELQLQATIGDVMACGANATIQRRTRLHLQTWLVKAKLFLIGHQR